MVVNVFVTGVIRFGRTSKMSNKSYGLGKEREAKHILESEGWRCHRSRGSFGVFDMISMNPTKGWKLIQVKATKQKQVSFKKDINEMLEVKTPSNTQKELWVYWSPRKDRTARGWERITIS